jgi:hypothetical protein
MPDVVEETTDKWGNKILKIWYGSYNGENKFIELTLKKATAVADNIDRIYEFVDKNDKNWKGKK